MALRIQDLYTFFVVARSGAMHEAARELGVSPGAISQRIRAIEEKHGRRLFSRSRKGIELTKPGEALWNEVRDAFTNIEAAHDRHFAGASKSTIRISAAPTFAYSSLVPRLGAFTGANPGIMIAIETDDRLVDLKTEPVDLAIRHGLGNYPGLKSEWLISPELIIVGSPKLLAKHGPVNEPADCLQYPLLQDSTGADWSLWFAAHGVDARLARYSTAFKDDFLTVKAATEGQGLALLNDVYVTDELKAGRLVKALDISWPTKFAYYAVALPETFQRPPVKIFMKWLKSVSTTESAMAVS